MKISKVETDITYVITMDNGNIYRKIVNGLEKLDWDWTTDFEERE